MRCSLGERWLPQEVVTVNMFCAISICNALYAVLVTTDYT